MAPRPTTAARSVTRWTGGQSQVEPPSRAGGLEEGGQLGDFGDIAELLAQARHGLDGPAAGRAQRAEGLAEGLDGLPGHPLSFETDAVGTVARDVAALSDGPHEREDVLRDHGEAAQERVPTDAAELVDGGEGAHRGAVPHADMAA